MNRKGMDYFSYAKSLATRDNTPTKTDQTGAEETDINVIVKRYGIHGQAPGAAQPAMFEDFTKLPQDFRAMVDQIRTLDELRDSLPAELKAMSIYELANMTYDEFVAKMPKPATPPAQPPAEPPSRSTT